MPANDDNDDGTDTELWELLTCHRDAPCLHLALYICPENQNPELPFPSLKWFTCPSTKESDGPFPWKAPAGSASVASVVTERPSQLTMTRPDISKPLARFVDEGRALGTIHFQAPKLGLSAGAVLQHAIRKVEVLFSKEEPLIFKIGWTHDPIWRWSNSMYGYKYARDCWSGMIILFTSHEPHGPAFLEAALIDKYQSNLTTIQPEILSI